MKGGNEYSYRGVDFDGFDQSSFIEAKSRGYAKYLRQATLDEDDNLTIGSATAQTKLDKLLKQLNSQLAAVETSAGSRLRYVMAESDALAKFKKYAELNLTPARYALIDWENVDNDFTFKGCP